MNGKVFFPNLDGLRFLAFFLVFWQHATVPLFSLLKTNGLLTERANNFFSTGWLGVSFFFVLSGFLITYLLLQEKSSNGQVSLRGFYARRVLRIFPLYYLVVVFGFALYPIIRSVLGLGQDNIGDFRLYSLFLGNFDMLSEQDRPGFIGVLWSLSIEEQFYLVWAVLVSFLPIKFIKYFLIVVIMISTGFRLLNDGNERVLYFHTFSVMSDLAIGGLAAYVSFNTASFCNFYNHLSRMSILAIYAIGLAFIFIIPTRFGVNPMNWVLRLALALFFAFVIAEQNYSQNSLIKMKKLKIVSWLGKITYGLYLLHMIALFAVTFFLFRVGLVATDMAYIVILAFGGFAVSVVISFLSYRFFESPFLRFKRYFAS